MTSRLVTVAHGTRTPAGNEVARELTLAAGALLGRGAHPSYVELAEPLFEAVVASDEPSVVVPLLLSTGFHLREDLPRMVKRARGPIVLGRPLGPHRLLAEAQVARLLEAGAPRDARVVLVAAGSSDPLATRDLDRAAELLHRSWGGPVVVATLSARGDRPSDVVRPGDAVSPYLLAPGYFATKLRRESLAAGATVVADVIGAHPLVAELVARRAGVLDVIRTEQPLAPSV